MSQLTLRITFQEYPKSVVLKLEGRIVGPWSDELIVAWAEFALSHRVQNMAVDLREVTYIDASGMQVLRQIYRETSAEIVANTPLTESFANQIQQNALSN
ncbi:MAG: STAS domain-containing protein [Acidobacteriaceae bacterium]|jgi:anti-anti-sigma regulatory factor|nr:STAS domain-containing protein [Acidobacteriaceae bacterium]